jgi:hypothetical protein
MTINLQNTFMWTISLATTKLTATVRRDILVIVGIELLSAKTNIFLGYHCPSILTSWTSPVFDG